jgi:hypothetical protein
LRQVGDLYTALGVRADPSLVESAVVEAGIRYNVDPDSPEVTSGKWRSSFSQDDLDAFMRVAGNTLAELGYETDRRVEPKAASDGAEAEEPPRTRRGLLRRKRREEEPEDPFSRRVTDRAGEIQRLLDRLVAAIVKGEPGSIAGLSSRRVTVQALTPTEDWKGRGAAALERFDGVIAHDAIGDPRQIRGDLHIAVPTAVAVMVFRSSHGERSLRIVAATFGERDKATRVVYYNMPLAEA